MRPGSSFISKFHPATVKEEQLQVSADLVMSPPELAVEDACDLESSFNSDSERYHYSFRSLDGGNYPAPEANGRSLAHQQPTGNGGVNAELGGLGTEPATRSREVRWWHKGRLGRRVKYPDAVNELLFQRSDLWTYVAPLSGMMMIVVSYHSYGILSNEWKVDLILFLLTSMASQKLGKALQYQLPELAVVLMVAADGLMTASFVIVTFNVLPDNLLCWKHFLLYTILIFFSAPYFLCFYHIYNEDVREPEEEPKMPTRDIDVSRLSTSLV